MAACALKAPFPWFGGKSRVAATVWERFGDVRNYVEPFYGSGAVLLGRPQPFVGVETINDADGFVANFWRAIQAAPDDVARWADWPVNENDLHARHAWLVERRVELTAKLEGDPGYFDAKIAGWWCWGLCCWIGGGWCSGKGPWRRVQGEDGDWRLAKNGDAGMGVNRKLPHLGDAGMGVNRTLPHLGPGGNGMHTTKVGESLYNWFAALADRLRRVRVCCGDWLRVCGATPTTHNGLTGVFLDPPYGDDEGRTMDCYAVDNGTVSRDVRQWAAEHGDDPKLRICVCGYDGWQMPAGWVNVPWKAQGGYGNQSSNRGRVNATRERLWFSPHCLIPADAPEPTLLERITP